MRIVWVSSSDSTHHVGGGGVYARALLGAIEKALPEAQIVRVESPRRHHHRLRQGASLLRAPFSRSSAKLLFDLDATMPARIDAAVAAGPCELVVYNGASAAAYDRHLPDNVPRVLVVHNLEFEVYRDQLRSSGAFVRRLFHDLLHDDRKYEAFERVVLGRVDACVAIAADEAARLPRLAGKALDVVNIPAVFGGPRFDPSRRRPSSNGQLRLTFLGKMGWWPNRQAVEWFLGAVWPFVPSDTYELHLYGAGSEAWNDPSRRIVGHGFVEDLATVWASTDIFVNPMQSGSGVNVKVCEALHHGLPLLTTKRGLRGLPELLDPAVVVCGDAREFLDALEPSAARALACRVPSESVRRLFSLERAVEQIGPLFRSLVRAS